MAAPRPTTRLHHSSAWHDVACMHRFELSRDLTDRPRVGAPSSCQLVFARGPRPLAWCRGSKVRALGQKPSPADRVLLEATLGSEPGTSPMCPEIVKNAPIYNLCSWPAHTKTNYIFPDRNLGRKKLPWGLGCFIAVRRLRPRLCLTGKGTQQKWHAQSIISKRGPLQPETPAPRPSKTLGGKIYPGVCRGMP